MAVHLQVNAPGGTFSVTACGRRHWPDGRLLGGDGSRIESVTRSQWCLTAPMRKAACKRCLKADARAGK
jgi:hypothetical protein